MKVDALVNAMPLRDIQILARDAESAGFSGLTITESGRTAYLSVAAAALASDLDLSTGIAVAFARSPMATASAAWELAEASNGRFRLGLGTQVRAHVARRYSADFDPPGPRLREYVLAVRSIFSAFAGELPLSFDGRFWHFSLLPQEWSPGPIAVGAPPIDIAAVNPWMLRMAGEVADGVHVHPLNTSTYLRQTVLSEIAAGAVTAHRDPADIDIIVPCFTVAGDNEAERSKWREHARLQIAFYATTPNYGFIFEQLGQPDVGPRLRSAFKAREFGSISAIIDDDLLAHFVVESSWSGLADAVFERFDGIADRVVLYFAGSAWRSDSAAFTRLGEIAAEVARR